MDFDKPKWVISARYKYRKSKAVLAVSAIRMKRT